MLSHEARPPPIGMADVRAALRALVSKARRPRRALVSADAFEELGLDELGHFRGARLVASPASTKKEGQRTNERTNDSPSPAKDHRPHTWHAQHT